METATTHEARARNAKAHALAAVLLERGATNADVKALHAAPPVFWEMAAFLATERELLGRTASGKVRRVHVPGYGSGDAAATIAAVARILGDLIAHENDQAAIAERRAEGEPMPGDDHITSTGETLGSLRRRSAEAVERGYRDRIATDYGRGRRRPTDSGEYRRTVGQLDPETAQAFSAFSGSDR